MPEAIFGRITVRTGDLTQEDVDAVVNAANSGLMGGGGVDGAIHRAGGPAIFDACTRIRATTHPDGLPAGEAVITMAGNLPARFVIHTVGPVWHGGARGEADILRVCYTSVLRLAVERGLKSVAFPAVSTGVYGYPAELAAKVAVTTVRAFLATSALPERVIFTLFGEAAYEAFLSGSGLASEDR